MINRMSGGGILNSLRWIVARYAAFATILILLVWPISEWVHGGVAVYFSASTIDVQIVSASVAHGTLVVDLDVRGRRRTELTPAISGSLVSCRSAVCGPLSPWKKHLGDPSLTIDLGSHRSSNIVPIWMLAVAALTVAWTAFERITLRERFGRFAWCGSLAMAAFAISIVSSGNRQWLWISPPYRTHGHWEISGNGYTLTFQKSYVDSTVARKIRLPYVPATLVLDNSRSLWDAFEIRLELWFVIVCLLLPLVVMVVRHRRKRATGTFDHHCRQCGYDLRATPERCPECGRIAIAAATG